MEQFAISTVCNISLYSSLEQEFLSITWSCGRDHLRMIYYQVRESLQGKNMDSYKKRQVSFISTPAVSHSSTFCLCFQSLLVLLKERSPVSFDRIHDHCPFQLVAWNLMKKPLNEGDHSFQSPVCSIWPLLGKWFWRLMKDNSCGFREKLKFLYIEKEHRHT